MAQIPDCDAHQQHEEDVMGSMVCVLADEVVDETGSNMTTQKQRKHVTNVQCTSMRRSQEVDTTMPANMQ